MRKSHISGARLRVTIIIIAAIRTWHVYIRVNIILCPYNNIRMHKRNTKYILCTPYYCSCKEIMPAVMHLLYQCFTSLPSVVIVFIRPLRSPSLARCLHNIIVQNYFPRVSILISYYTVSTLNFERGVEHRIKNNNNGLLS